MKIILTILLNFLLLANFINAQDATKVKVIGLPNGTALAAADIAIATISPTNNMTKAVGYNYRTDNNKIGIIVMTNTNSIVFNKTYSISNKDINLIKIITRAQDDHSTDLLLLCGLTERSKSIPLIINIDKNTGAVIWAQKLSTLNINAYSQFYPRDIIFKSASNNEVLILCEGKYLSPVSGSPASSLTLINYDVSSFGYNTQELYNPLKLNSIFQQTGFVKKYHWSTQIFEPVSICGYVDDNFLNKGFLYFRDNMNNSYFKTYSLNNQNTIGLQVNGNDLTPEINMILQNSNYELSMSGLNTYSLSNSWQKFYSEPTQKFVISYTGHGLKSSLNQNNFFTGYYGIPGGITNTNGYGFLRYNLLTGSINQDFWYDLSLNDYTSIFHLYDDYFDKSSFLCSGLMTLQATPYLYLIERTLSANVPNCTQNIGLIEESGNLLVENETMTVIQDNQDRASTSELISESNLSINLEEICTDNGRNVLPESKTEDYLRIVSRNNMIYLSNLEKTISQVIIYSSDGKLLATKKISNSKFAECYLEKKFSSGLFIIKIKYTDNSLDNRKIILY